MIRRKLNFKNKNAQIGATITWFVAFLVILFIMILFIFFASLAGGKKILSFASFKQRGVIVGLKGLSEDADTINSLESVMKSKINIDGKEELFFYAILESLEPLISSQKILKDYLSGDINNLGLMLRAVKGTHTSQVIATEVLLAEGYDENKEKKLKPALEKELDRICDKYYFEIPNLIIDKSGGWVSSVSSEVLLEDYTSEIILNAYYKGNIIKIKYRQLKTC